MLTLTTTLIITRILTGRDFSPGLFTHIHVILFCVTLMAFVELDSTIL